MSDRTKAPDTPDLRDEEPSMEDILASIRKVIAADNETPPMLNEFGAPKTGSTLGNVDTTEDILDLVNFVDESTGGETDANAAPDTKKAAAEAAPQIDHQAGPAASLVAEALPVSSAASNIASKVEFDETLDLVMDANASDYLTTNMEASAATAANGDDVVPNGTDEKMSIVAGQQAEDDMDLVKSLLSDLMDEPDTSGDESASLDTSEEIVADDAAHSEADVSTAELDTEAEAVSSPVEAIAVDTETGLETEQADDDLNAVFDELLDENMADEANISVDDADVAALADSSVTNEDSDLASIAKQAAVTPDIETPQVENPDDEVVLEDLDFKAKFTLLSGGAAAVVGASALANKNDSVDSVESVVSGDEQEAQATMGAAAGVTDSKETSSKPQLETLLEQGAEQGEDVAQALEETKATEIKTEGEAETEIEIELDSEQVTELELKENEPMATRITKAKLVDEATERETGEVFASLTHAVEEKSRLDESGPPIGDIVQAALQPMLQDWLDKNLKDIVERSVKEEIKRISAQK